MLAFAANPAESGYMDYIYAAMIGMFTSGPQMLIGGLCAVESSSKKVASASIGFTGIFGYVGAALSSGGTGVVVDKFGWNGAITFWMISTMICVVICTILMIYEKMRKNKQSFNDTRDNTNESNVCAIGVPGKGRCS